MLSLRKASFGYGTKFDFTKGVIVTPSPNKYTIKSEIDLRYQIKYGCSFGVSREKMTGGGIFEKHLVSIPGLYLIYFLIKDQVLTNKSLN